MSRIHSIILLIQLLTPEMLVALRNNRLLNDIHLQKCHFIMKYKTNLALLWNKIWCFLDFLVSGNFKMSK